MIYLERHINYIILIKKDFSLGRKFISTTLFIVTSLENYFNFDSYIFSLLDNILR